MTRSSELTYTPAWWVPGAHLQTLWGKLFRHLDETPTRVERWTMRDGDDVEVRRLDAAEGAPANAPRLVMLHGLEGTIRSHYLQGTLARARALGWAADVLIFRGCDGQLNRAQRLYHSGETSDLDQVVHRIAEECPEAPIGLLGYSLGGNVLLKWLGEQGSSLPPQVGAAVAVSVPYDLERGSRHLERGFSRIYTRHFLRTLRVKAEAKHQQFPAAFNAARLAAARTLFDFDDAVTAPLHGFADASDYYTRSSSRHFLAGIRVPTLLLSASDDPFLPREVLDAVREAARHNGYLHAEFHPRGGHVGFVSGRNPFHPMHYAEARALEFLNAQLSSERRASVVR